MICFGGEFWVWVPNGQWMATLAPTRLGGCHFYHLSCFRFIACLLTVCMGKTMPVQREREWRAVKLAHNLGQQNLRRTYETGTTEGRSLDDGWRHYIIQSHPRYNRRKIEPSSSLVGRKEGRKEGILGSWLVDEMKIENKGERERKPTGVFLFVLICFVLFCFWMAEFSIPHASSGQQSNHISSTQELLVYL